MKSCCWRPGSTGQAASGCYELAITRTPLLRFKQPRIEERINNNG
jgi:hypothetical protein